MRGDAMTGRRTIAAGTMFDGMQLHRDCTVVIEGERIVEVQHGVSPGPRGCPGVRPAGSDPVHTLPEGAWLAPGFIDCQVNGGGDVLLNDAPTAETVHR